MTIISQVGSPKTTCDLWVQYPADELRTLYYMHLHGVPADALFEMHRLRDIPLDRAEYLKHNLGLPNYMLEE